jgi:RNA polymerase sigma-70 factor (ECF subfamily)
VHASRIYNLARRMLSNEADVEDVTQEVLLRVVRKLDTFRGEAELTTGLHRVTVSAVLVRRRKQAVRACDRQQRVAAQRGRATVPKGAPADDEDALNHESWQFIERAIVRLPAPYRDAFVLADVHSLTNAEIGSLLKLSKAAVKSRIHRARLLLCDALAPYFARRSVG